jgi:hypothetical protein
MNVPKLPDDFSGDYLHYYKLTKNHKSSQFWNFVRYPATPVLKKPKVRSRKLKVESSG